MNPRLATIDELPTCARALGSAFEHYPWTRYVVPEESYHKRLHELQLLYLEYAHRYGIIAVAEDIAGATALLPPDTPEPAPEMIDQIVRLHGDRIDRLSKTPPAADQPDSAWRLETLGVHPDYQGRGIASALLRFALDEVSRRGGESVVLDTSDPRNVRLYERHGFKTIGYTDLSDGPSVWNMSISLKNSHDTEDPVSE